MNKLQEPEVQGIINQIAAFPFTLERAQVTMEPCVIVENLINLCQAVSFSFNTLKVLAVADPEVAVARRLLFQCAKITIGNGLRILGLEPLERM